MSERTSLGDACAVWQSDRDGGSTPLRAAARVLTGTPHYFQAPFIDEKDREAAADPVALGRARELLDAVAASNALSAAAWCERFALSPAYAGRGLKAKGPEDEQIFSALRSGRIEMPLWGLSLDEAVARERDHGFLPTSDHKNSPGG